MSWWWILALVVGVLWTIAGSALTALTLTFKDGLGGSGPGWGGVTLMAGITCIGPVLIVLAVVTR